MFSMKHFTNSYHIRVINSWYPCNLILFTSSNWYQMSSNVHMAWRWT